MAKNKMKIEFPGFVEMFDKLILNQKKSEDEKDNKKKFFIDFIELYQKTTDKNDELNKQFNISLYDYTDDYEKCIGLLLNLLFSVEDKDWICWWLYERISVTGKINKVYHKNGKEILMDTSEDLWNFLIENNKGL